MLDPALYEGVHLAEAVIGARQLQYAVGAVVVLDVGAHTGSFELGDNVGEHVLDQQVTAQGAGIDHPTVAQLLVEVVQQAVRAELACEVERSVFTGEIPELGPPDLKLSLDSRLVIKRKVFSLVVKEGPHELLNVDVD